MTAQRAMLFLGGLATLVAVDYFVLRALGISYVRWYVENGALISLFLAALAVGIDLDREPDLVASNPRDFVSSWLRVPGLVFLTLAALVRNDRRPIDGLLTGILGLPLVAIWLCFLIVIVPLQYFVTLVTGAPARLARAEKIELARNPVTTTSAFTAVVLFAVSFVV